VSDHFRTLAKLLRQEVQGPVYARLYCDARPRHPVLAAYVDLASLLAALAKQSDDDYSERDAITLALLRERAAAHESQWSAVLAVVYLPMLLRLRRQLVCAELPKDDLDQLVLEAFLVAIASYRPDSWRGRTPIRLTHLTRRRVFKSLRRELTDRRWREGQRDLAQASPGQVPAGSASSPPVSFQVDAVLAALADHVSEEGAFLVRETELGSETLYSIVSRMNLESDEERERLYQRLKRVRSRAKKRLRDVIAASPP
jgi:hypothetical protein